MGGYFSCLFFAVYSIPRRHYFHNPIFFFQWEKGSSTVINLQSESRRVKMEKGILGASLASLEWKACGGSDLSGSSLLLSLSMIRTPFAECMTGGSRVCFRSGTQFDKSAPPRSQEAALGSPQENRVIPRHLLPLRQMERGQIASKLSPDFKCQSPWISDTKNLLVWLLRHLFLVFCGNFLWCYLWRKEWKSRTPSRCRIVESWGQRGLSRSNFWPKALLHWWETEAWRDKVLCPRSASESVHRWDKNPGLQVSWLLLNVTFPWALVASTHWVIFSLFMYVSIVFVSISL